MPLIRIVASVLIMLALMAGGGCGTPVPEGKREYVGKWTAPNMRLEIEAGGRVHYERRDGTARREINAPIIGFRGDDLVVGVGCMNTTFKVAKPPYRDGNVWKMVVDGVELTRVRRPVDSGVSI